MGHRRNLEQDVDVDQYQQDEKWQCLHYQRRVRHALAKLDVVIGQDVGQNIHGRRSDDLIKAEPEICHPKKSQSSLSTTRNGIKIGPSTPMMVAAIAP